MTLSRQALAMGGSHMIVQKSEILEDTSNTIGGIYDYHRRLMNVNHQRDKRNTTGRDCRDNTTSHERLSRETPREISNNGGADIKKYSLLQFFSKIIFNIKSACSLLRERESQRSSFLDCTLI